MTTWEIQDKDNRIIPTDLVREQDFILKIRRLHRLGMIYEIVNLVLNGTDSKTGGRGLLEEAHMRLTNWAKQEGIDIVEMSNGDLFLLCGVEKEVLNWPETAFKIAWPEGLDPEKAAQVKFGYRLPSDYAGLRERINTYVELSRKVAAETDDSSPFQLLQTEAARGPLNAWSSGQIQRLLDQIDLTRYVRWQPICEHQTNGQWKKLFDECYIGFEQLRLERFPKLEMTSATHLFLALCEGLDQHLLAQLANNPEKANGQSFFLNISVASITSGMFARFVKSFPAEMRSSIGFELHRGDIFEDFAATLNAIAILRHEGFKIAIDSVSPHVLPYLNLYKLDVDYVKINVAKDRCEQLSNPEVLSAIQLIPRNKIIFFRCDNEQALTTGLTLGVTRFQGWLIDDYIHVMAL